jgi:hypothetical protein
MQNKVTPPEFEQNADGPKVYLRRRIAIIAIGCLAVLVGFGAGLAPQSVQHERRQSLQDSTALGATDSVATDTRLLGAVRYLASDELEGRGVGTRGLDLAADYVASQFRSLGLRTDLCDNSPFQTVSSSTKLALRGNNRLELSSPTSGAQLALGVDFRPLSLSASGTFDLPLFFCGHGITSEEDGYDDYGDVDVAGKAVIVLRHTPWRDGLRSRAATERISPHAYISRKVENAAAHGAAAVIICTNRGKLLERELLDKGGDASSYGQTDLIDARDRLLDFSVSAGRSGRQIPVAHVRRSAIDDILKAAFGTDLFALEEAIHHEQRPKSLELTGCRIRGECNVARVTSKLKNVVALLEGSGVLPDETVVVGAHYDHLGYGGGWGSLAPWTKEVHNGADDNASGTAVLIEVARQLALRRDDLQRRVLFVGFTAEESGLVGSDYFVSHPPVPIRQQVAMVNLDMVGYLRDNRLTISGTGTAREFPRLIDELASVHGLTISKDPSGYGPSDHASFHRRGIPVLHLFTGFHENYHRPSDDPEKLNVAGMRRIVEFTTEIVVQLANAQNRPGPAISRQHPYEIVTNNSRSLTGPRLGVVGDPSFTGTGLLVQSTVKRSVADRAGIRANDLIVQLNGVSVADAADFEQVLAKLASDQPVRVTVRRSSTLFEFELPRP